MLRGALNGLAARLIIGSVLVIAVAAGTATWQARGDLLRQSQARYAERVIQARTKLEREILADASLRVVSASALAAQQALQAAIAGGNASTLLGLIAAAAAPASGAGAGASGIHVYDARGVLIARSERPATPPAAAVSEVARVLTSKMAEGFLRQDDSLGLVVSGIAPVVTAGGSVLGAVEAIRALDNASASTAAAHVGLPVTFMVQGRVAGASAPETAIDSTALTDQLRTDAAAGPVYLSARSEPHLTSRATLAAFDGRTLGDLYVGVARSAIEGSAAEAHAAVLRSTAVGAALALAIAAGLAWYTARPVRQLVTAGRRI